MNDIEKSLRRASIRDQWIFGERMNRIGDPFKWVDGDQIPQLQQIDGGLAYLQYLAMSGEIYETPDEIKTSDYIEIYEAIKKKLYDSFNYFCPFISVDKLNFKKYIESTASVKQQDYCAIKTYCKDLPDKINQLDIGPGLGANVIYSHIGFDSCYYSLEAYPASYKVQRDFFKFISAGEGSYLDLVECDTFDLSMNEIISELNSTDRYNIKHIPSWYFNHVEEESIDLVSATWVLNEVTPAGISWILCNLNNCLKKGGYVYIRDSNKRKPLRHDINYDDVLSKLGYKKIVEMDIKNRVDMHGIPRVYQKTSSLNLDFDSFFDECYGKFAVTSHSGGYMQNVEKNKI
jgi:hypothetical protein